MWQRLVKNAALQHNPLLIWPECRHGYSKINKNAKIVRTATESKPPKTVRWFAKISMIID